VKRLGDFLPFVQLFILWAVCLKIVGYFLTSYILGHFSKRIWSPCLHPSVETVKLKLQKEFEKFCPKAQKVEDA
jgi:hypothetical protein